MTKKRIALVLLPGLDGTGRLFSPLTASLPDSIEPIVVDYPVDRPLDYAELLPLITRSLPPDNDFVILGESFSGPLAVMAAAARPAGLTGIILCASFVKNPFRILPAWAGHLSVAPIYEFWPATIRLRALLAGGQYEKLAKLALDAIKSVSPTVIARRVKSILTVNVEQSLADLDVPVLYLAGRKDRLIRRHNLTGIRKIRPGLQVAILDTNHFVLQLKPEQSAAEIARFLDSLQRNEVDSESAGCEPGRTC